MKLSTLAKTIFKAVIFVLVAVLTVYLYPRAQHDFKYRYEIGKPWSYERLVADFDFPIYKTSEQLAKEEKEVLRDAIPYYMFIANRPHSPLVIAAQDLEQFKEDGYDRIGVISNQVSHTYYLSQLHTPKTVFLATNQELQVNLALDTATTNQIRRDLVRNISLTRGMVQAGEKIVDKGDIVDAHTAAILNSLRKAYELSPSNKHISAWSIVGEILIVLLYLVMFVLYLYVFRPNLLNDNKAILFFCILVMLLVLIMSAIMRYTTLSIYLIPFAWIPILVRCFYDARTGLFLFLTTILMLSSAVPNSLEFLVIQIAVGMVAVASMKEMTQRAQLAQTAGWIFITYTVAYTAFVLGTQGAWHNIDPWMYLYFAINAILVLGAYALIFIFEKVFRLISPVTLVELTDINSSLLLEFAEKAPGSFQHSMQVSTLAMDAAKSIGAKTLLVRTGALYHDIGKMANAASFTENQHDGHNPLTQMTPQEAAQVVINHVKEGVKIAKSHHLPQVIVHFIETHHGTSLTRYFYHTALNQSADVNEADFRYPGPKPTTKEAAIIMMADAVEARSRSLKEFTETSISEMVDDMINLQISEGQLSETPLSFKDVEVIRKVFKERLAAMNHQRVKYPTVEQSRP